MTFQAFAAEIARRLALPMVVIELPDDYVRIDLEDDPHCVYTCSRTLEALAKAEIDLAMRAKTLKVVTVH